MGQIDERGNDDAGGRVGVQFRGQGPVDLDDVDREPVQVGESGVAGPEVVERDPNPELADGFELVDDVVVLVYEDGFGDLENQAGRVCARAGERAFEVVRERAVAELQRGDVQ